METARFFRNDFEENGPARFHLEAKEQDIRDSGKLVELFNILRGVIVRREKALVFFCRTATSELLAALMEREFGIRPGIMRGDATMNDREKMIREFRADAIPGEPRSQVLLLSVFCGAVGLNLPEARWVVHVERVWNPALELQATCRVHRLTSQHPVKAYCLFTEDTVEARKCAVLSAKHRLSVNIIEDLDRVDGERESGQGDEAEEVAPSSDAAAAALLELISGDASGGHDARDGSSNVNSGMAGQDSDEDDNLDAELVAELETQQDQVGEVDEEDDEEDGKTDGAEERKSSRLSKSQGLYPDFQKLQPRQLKQPMMGKYGDPRDKELWDWYTSQGRKEVHEKAPLMSTAGLHLPAQGGKTQQQEERLKRAHRPFTSRPSRIRDARERKDHEMVVDLGEGVSCRLFVPDNLRGHFTDSEAGSLQLRPPAAGEAPFPVFMPSTGRSALDEEVGMLDLTATMLDSNGKQLDFLQIVAVRPSEVDKYRMSAPFFVVMELPTCGTVQHQQYGSLKPEELGVGCSRHWMVRLASALGAGFVFMLDDSIRAWRGVTLVEDPHPMFGLPAGRRARFTPVPLGQVLQYFAEPRFLAEELPKYVALGFARFSPDLMFARKAYSRSQIYSSFLLNISRVQQEELNFRQDVFVWEDLLFNLKAHDVVRCSRFAMMKRPYRTGGCANQIARSANPILRVGNVEKLSPDQLAAEALGEQCLQGQSEPADGRKKRGRKKVKGVQEVAEAQAIAQPSSDDPFVLEDDPALKPESAVCDANGNIMNKYYKGFIQAFKDTEKKRLDPAAPTGLKCPGVRKGESVPDGLRVWDDTKKARGCKSRVSDLDEQFWGAGWIAYPPSKKGSKWFNIKIWGSWRLAFVLARLQYQVWQQKHAAENPSSPSGEAGTTPKAKTAKSTSDDATSGRKAERGRGRPSTKSHQASSGSGIGHHKENKEGKENKEKGKRANQPSSVKRTLDMFFPMKKELSADGSSAAAPPSPKQQKLFGFFKGGRSSASSSDGQAERPAETTAEEAASPELKRCKLESDAEPAGITSVPPYCG